MSAIPESTYVATIGSDPESAGGSNENLKHIGAPKRAFRSTYGFFGFRKGYNFILWFIFGGAMLGFTLARFQYLHVPTLREGVSPGEWYWYRQPLYKIGILLHLACILPAGFLVVFQFVPQIRYKAIWFHRINGRVILVLLVISTAGVLIIIRRTEGGEVVLQAGLYLLAIVTMVSAGMAFWNIKRLRIDQHRNWMLRTWFYAASIITLRIVMIISALIIAGIASYHSIWTCDEIAFLSGNATSTFKQEFPQCLSATSLKETYVSVQAKWTDRLHIGSAFRVTFGMATWVAFAIHAIGVEIYIHLTGAESLRLKKVSYQKQIERGLRDPGLSDVIAK